jgi:hypothetical protein
MPMVSGRNAVRSTSLLPSRTDDADAEVFARVMDTKASLGNSPAAAPAMPAIAGGCDSARYTLHADDGSSLRRMDDEAGSPIPQVSMCSLVDVLFGAHSTSVRWSRRFFVLNNHVLFTFADDANSSGPTARPLSVCLHARAQTHGFKCILLPVGAGL